MNWLLAHFVGDFLLQNDWQAKGKKAPGWRGAGVCTVHVFYYILPFLFCGLAWWQLLLIGVQHWAQDRTGFIVWLMKVSGKKPDGFLGPPMAPWSVIVTDNIVHVLWMAFIVWLPKSGM